MVTKNKIKYLPMLTMIIGAKILVYIIQLVSTTEHVNILIMNHHCYANIILKYFFFLFHYSTQDMGPKMSRSVVITLSFSEDIADIEIGLNSDIFRNAV